MPTLTFGKKHEFDNYAVECSCREFQRQKEGAIKHLHRRGIEYKVGDVSFECPHMDAHNAPMWRKRNDAETEANLRLTPEDYEANRVELAKMAEDW